MELQKLGQLYLSKGNSIGSKGVKNIGKFSIWGFVWVTS